MDILGRLHPFWVPRHNTELGSRSESVILATPPGLLGGTPSTNGSSSPPAHILRGIILQPARSRRPGAFERYRMRGMLSEEAGQSVHMANISDDGYVDCEFGALGDIPMERLTLEDELEVGEDTEVVGPIPFPGHGLTATFSLGPSNEQSHPSPACERFSPLATSSSWVTTPGSAQSAFQPPQPMQSLTTLPVEVRSAGPSWVTVGPSLGVTPDMNSRPSISTNHTDNTLAYDGNELHPAFGSGIQAIASTLKKRPRPRYVPKLQIAEDVFLTRDVAHAKRLRQNYILGAPRLRGYRDCTATGCSCRLGIEDFEQSPTTKRLKFTHMSDARVGCS